MRLGLAGPSHIPYSQYADSQRTLNLFPELVEGGRGKAEAVLYGTPGLELLVNLAASDGIKALYYDTWTARTFVVKRRSTGGVLLSELTTTTELADTEVHRGDLLSTGGTMHPVSISSNGFELFIVLPAPKKAFLFVLATNTLTEITSSVGNTNPVWGAFLDGYFIALDDNGKLYSSSPNDGATWDALDVATPESNPDRALMIHSNAGHLWVFGPESIEIWINTGGAAFPFDPIKYATLQMGILYPYSVLTLNGHIYFVGRDESGAGTVFETSGYQARAVSNHAVTRSIQSTAVTGAEPVAWSHESMGHYFYVLTFPDDDLTWSYDIGSGRDAGWHERSYFDGTDHEAHRGRCCAYVGGQEGTASAHLVGDRESGKIYKLSLDSYDDDGSPIRRVRRAQHLSDEMVQIAYHGLELDVEKGVGPARYNLRWSNDGGRTFNSSLVAVVAEIKVYTYSNGSWGSGIAIPAGETFPTGVAVKSNGDILVVGTTTDKVYTHSGGAWDAGLAVPSAETSPSGVAVKSNGDILVVGITTDKVYTHSGGAWDAGLAVPSAETSPRGVAVKSNGDILVVGITTDKVYTHSGGAWDAGLAIPSAEAFPRGVAVKSNGDILVVGDITDKVYTHSGGAWDAGLAIPSAETYSRGVAVKSNGDILVVSQSSIRLDINPEWRALGTGRDRVFEVSSESPVKHVWLDAYMRVSKGAH